MPGNGPRFRLSLSGAWRPESRAAVEAIVALVAAFLPMSGEQVATILDVVAVLTGEQVVRKVRSS